MSKNIKLHFGVLLTAFLTLTATSAFAALSIDQTAVVTAIETLYTDMSAVGWKFVLIATTLFVGIKIFKKVMGKST